ncbi:hypothetical protein RFI_03263 [Reticulomyxa filosa]|uniref:Uncharacterized protein n=1 Tax=Reticulomyxa filosa TaxID=46433 RepID=X6P6X5_RETFI|nr:hypothetical protein RFI_03263 [Reticulomyxa filosa]|eukprot:ETO33839.1 hypothetical protein RFI_03263 [Reticulomyxa filosa]
MFVRHILFSGGYARFCIICKYVRTIIISPLCFLLTFFFASKKKKRWMKSKKKNFCGLKKKFCGLKKKFFSFNCGVYVSFVQRFVGKDSNNNNKKFFITIFMNLTKKNVFDFKKIKNIQCIYLFLINYITSYSFFLM